ncbi:hypothetical protein ADH76_20790 [Enterocloster clostridioformis]|uniref:DUF2586 domain-containing protein n=1 Tax=Enterocloster clostridioformis TaxID=1531 RepID=UPI00080C8848|nr:DUF2586 domain-containing protein [Enterocloster clostridioformis]ANU47202.1 hypothetical protein A4V08_16725 [Lachnoclostridium sp. YL32]WAK79629.1 tail sheath [Clostridium phage Villandry]ANU47417.1 hypothetical protein A4V08_18090 [Lachnoclostridium sp. YL32]NDO30958.1 DUF2586 family protein [Enterocloster clostridioformis]OXE66394.1 hypothetical protein ADH76_20790 [Enterocloster clostridioformis]
MSLRDVTFVVEDGSLGNSGSTGTGVHVKIGASPVETTVPILITGSMKPEQMKEKLGLSPLADACIDSVENGASRIYCVPVRPETVGTNGKVTHSGTGEGTVSVSGTPNNAYDIILKITEDGPPNTAAFCCSVNGGYSYDAEETIPLGGKKELAGTGIALTFAEEFKAGDTYRFSTTAPAVSNSAVLKAVESLYNSDLDFEFIHVAGTSAKALWASLAASAELFLSLYKRPVFFLCEARNKGAEESLDEYAAALKAEAKGIDSYYVQVCSAWSQYTRWDGREQCINNAGIAAGLYGIAGVAQSIGRVDTFSISEAKMTRLMPEGIEDYISELDDAGYLTWRKYYGIAGCYVNNARVLCREGSDYRYAEHVRVLNKMIREIYKQAVNMVQMDISVSDDMETDINNILETLNIPLEDMAEAGELSSGSVSIEDLEHVNILQDEHLDLVVSFVPRGYVREFRFSLAMENPYRN